MENQDFGYLNAIHKDLWKVVEVGCEIPDEDETPTPLQQYMLQKKLSSLKYSSHIREPGRV